MDRTVRIFLRYASRRDSRRPALFVVAALIHVGIITTLADSARTRLSRKKPAASEPILAVFMDSAVSAPPSPAEDAITPPPLSPADLARLSVTPSIPEITLPPDERNDSPVFSGGLTDLEAAARAAIARQIERDAAPRIGAHPKGMKPPKRPSHAPGETQDVGNGEVLTWVDDYCFYSNRVKPRSNGIGGVKPLCMDEPPPYQSLDDWVKSRRKLADERDED
jgi:hypothetical protein